LSDVADQIASQKRLDEYEQMLSITAHNLREPLRQILTYAQLIRQDHQAELSDPVAGYVEHIERHGRRLSNLVDGLTELSVLSSRALRLRHTDLSIALQGAIFRLSSEIETSRARVENKRLMTVEADDEIVTTVLQHLLGNAIKFHTHGSPPLIQLRAESEHGEVTISVKDDGIGIDPDKIEKCFGLFQRLNARSDFPGEGVGLAYCKRRSSSMAEESG